jgi:hypothetical protein
MSALPNSLVRYRTELEAAIRREQEAQAGERNGRASHVLRLVRRRPGRTLLTVALVAGATAAALFVSPPWRSSPGFVERAHAALTPPAGTVLHMKLVMTSDYGPCKVTHPPVEYWVDLTPPYNWRAFEVKQTDLCTAGTSIEIGAEGASRKPTLVFRSPGTLETTPEWPNDPGMDPDPYGGIRQALNDGKAHDDGRTVLDGRPVERIRIDCDEAAPTCDPIYAYVDPETFLPVRTVAGGTFVQDFLTYEYLPGTPANRALADIRAQHPDATGP